MGNTDRGAPMLHTSVISAQDATALKQVRVLFREYQASLDVDLCFQDFETEVSTLPGAYSPPGGRLYLGCIDDEPACCGALRAWDGDTAEMKRLYVRPSFRGRGYGLLLARTIIHDAVSLHYHRLVLDTLPSMRTAQAMYEALGFRDIPPYRTNPVPGARYMALNLTSRSIGRVHT